MIGFKQLRGGAWDFTSRDCRSACRIRGGTDYRSSSVGFHIVCTMKPPTTKLQPLRGGSCHNSPWICRSASRISTPRHARGDSLGFRIVCPIKPKSKLIRGGSWLDRPRCCRSSFRGWPGIIEYDIGFRIVCKDGVPVNQVAHTP